MSMDLTGITNKNEYYTNHYFSTVFEENTRATISGWNAAARESEEIKTPWSLLRQNARQYYTAHDKFVRSSVNLQVLANIKALVGNYLKSLGYPEAKPEVVAVDDSLSVPVYLEMTKSNGAPLLWVLLSASKESDAGIMESLRYMYRMLFVLFIESRPELGYAPIKAQSYYSGYSLESLRDIADNIRDDVNEVGDGYYLHETLAKLYELIYDGYPKTEDELKKATGSDSLHDMFLIAPLKAHIFDPEYTKMITAAKLRNSCMLRIIDLMSLTRATGRKNGRRGRISYVNLGINQMGAVYEALLSYRGFIAEHDLYEVKRAGDSFNELDVGYFVSESELEQYTEDERVRYESGEKAGKLRMYEKGTFIYRLAGREREKSASYYTPEVLTKCLVKYALKELLEGKTADEILKLTICEPAMGSAAFLNEAINQLAEAYISRKEKETGEIISYEKRFNELQKVKMFIADRNVYGIDLNPVAVELAEVSLWLNTIYEAALCLGLARSW